MKTKREAESRGTTSRPGGLVFALPVLTAVSFAALNKAVETRSESWVAPLGYVSVTLLFVTSLVVMFVVARIPQRTRLPKPYPNRRNEVDPTFRYALGTRRSYMFLAVMCAALTALLISLGINVRMVGLSGLFCLISVLGWIYLSSSIIQFQPEAITFRSMGRKVISYPYREIKRIRSTWSGIQIILFDGSTLNIYQGLGHPDLLVEQLRERCEPSTMIG